MTIYQIVGPSAMLSPNFVASEAHAQAWGTLADVQQSLEDELDPIGAGRRERNAEHRAPDNACWLHLQRVRNRPAGGVEGGGLQRLACQTKAD